MSKKIDIINDCYSQLRISGLTVQPTPESLSTAIFRLENMMSELEIRNICLGYNFEDVPDGDTETGVKHGFNQMMATNLAVRLIPDFNKQVPITLMGQASQSLSVASAYSARNRLRGVPYPNRQPIGGANTLRYSWWRRFYSEAKPTKTDCNTKDMLTGDVNDFYEDFHTYLEGDSIQSYTIESTSGLTVSNDVISGERINYRITAISLSESSTQRVTIIITTNTGRIETRVINFNVRSPDKALV